MKKSIAIYIAIIISININPLSFAAISGNVKKEKRNLNQQTNKLIDGNTQDPISNAKVKIPAKNFMTITDEDGQFDLNAKINAPTIMSIEKDGYKPYSMTLNAQSASRPFVIGIEKSKPHDIVIEKNMCHIGDDVYSGNSANAADFQSSSVGAFYSKDFFIRSIPVGKKCYLVIGSVIGVDTLMAKQLGQSKVKIAYSSPAEIYFNGKPISEIKINGDGQKIELPEHLLRQNQNNEVTIKAGKNLFNTSRLDYDDIEFMNLMIEFDE